MYRLDTSIRTKSAADTLDAIAGVMGNFGITRVTDVTRLDRIGIPVSAAIRPDAERNSLCVSAGKGVNQIDAKVGAIMEAIEFSVVEARRHKNDLLPSTPQQVCDQAQLKIDFVDFCPVYGAPLNLEEQISVTQVHDLVSGEGLIIPAELVYFPYNENPFQQLFGTSTNGLCSGNTLAEASIHGIFEVLERDTQSFSFFEDTSALVDWASSETICQLMKTIHAAGLTALLRHTEGEHGFSYFQAYIFEADDASPIAISSGTGCHFSPEIAATRAVTEAAQSRLSYVHGGRDDLIDRTHFFDTSGRDAELDATRQLRERVHRKNAVVSLDQISSPGAQLGLSRLNDSDMLDWIVSVLLAKGFPHILRKTLHVCDALTVARVVIPKMESFDPALKRMGPRLLRAALKPK